MNSAASADDLKKDSQDLQINVGLANTTDVTEASSFTSPSSVATRSNNDISDEWKQFYDDVEMIPPKAVRDIEFKDAVAKANNLLCLSDIADFKNKSFEDLTNNQKAIMMFMIRKEMDDLDVEGDCQAVAKALINVLASESPEYGRMMSFIHKGWDSTCYAETLKRFNQIRGEFVDSCEDATTIFQQNDAMPPYLPCQREGSCIYAFSACSALIYYCSYGLGSNPGVSAITTNVSRFIRDEIEGLKIANLAWTTKKGAYLDKILTMFMLNFGTADRDIPQKIELALENEYYNYTQLSLYIGRGCPIALSIECFPGLADFEKKEYTGKLSDHYDENKRNYDKRCKNRDDREYHALVCIGIKPRHGETPPMLLVQDSYFERPAFSIGLDLLMDIGIRDLQFYTLPIVWEPNPGVAYKLTKSSKAVSAGSPMSIDKNGKAQILLPKKTLPEKRDMSRYLHKPGHQVYFT